MTVPSQHRLGLLAVPSEPFGSMIATGWAHVLRGYFNPAGLFSDVHIASPLETDEQDACGMHVHAVTGRSFVETIQAIRPDVIRAYGGFWPADLVCQNRVWNVPVVVSVHDRRPEMIHPSVAYADRVVCVSQACARAAERRGCDPRRIRVIPNRINRSVFRRVEGKSGGQSLDSMFPPGKHILHVARKSPEKNLDTLLKALKLLPDEYSVVAVGRGDGDPYKRLACELGLGMRYFAVDAVPNDELPAWYSWCDCMCVPSRAEGFGIVFIEAAACGAVVVTSDMAPMTEYFLHEQNAVLVKNHEDPACLASVLRRACEDQDLRRRLAAGSVEVAARFDSEAIEQLEAAMYQEVLEAGGPGMARRMEIRLWLLRLAAGRLAGRIDSVRIRARLMAGRFKRVVTERAKR